MAPLVRTRHAVALAVLGGLLVWLAFPPVAVGWSAIPGIALLTAACWHSSVRRGAAVGALGGLTVFVLLLEWMRVIGMDAWLSLSALCALWLVLWGMAAALLSRLPLAPVWIACAWILQEALRARIPLGGFPWGSVAYTQVDTTLLAWARVAGAPFLSGLVAFTGAALVPLVLALRRRDSRVALGWSAAVAVAVLAPLLMPMPTGGEGDPPTQTIALVQGGTPQTGMGAMDVRRAVLDNHVRETMALGGAIAAGDVAQPAFVLWPENASDIDPFGDADAAAAITAAARAVNAPILVGAITPVPGRTDGVWNVGVVWDPQSGPQQMYVKTHPVPFGEYVPFRSLLAPLISRFDRVPRDFIAGDKPGLLTIAGTPVGNVICFEIAYREIVDAVVNGGARVLTVQTNNATYGGTAQPAQQLQIERLRAAEFGRSLLVAATSGISAVVLADGTVEQRMDEGHTGWLVADVPLRDTDTPATMIGGWLELLACAAAVGALVAVGVRSHRSRSAAIA